MFNIDPVLNDSRARDWILLFTDSAVTSVPLLSETNGRMASIFQGLVHLVHKLCAHSSSDKYLARATTAAIAGAINNSSHSTATTDNYLAISDVDVDIVETVGFLSVLYQFVFHYLDHTESSASRMTSTVDYSHPLKFFDVTSSLMMLLYDVREILFTRLHSFEVEQIRWIKSQKWDIKKPGVSTPFSKFTSLAYQILEMLCGQMLDDVDNMMVVLAKELVRWLLIVSEENKKHSEIFKYQNLLFIEITMADVCRFYTLLKIYIDETMTPMRIEAENKYTLWMISYEFEYLGTFANKLEKLDVSANDEDLASLLPSNEASLLLKELDLRSVELKVSMIRKRLRKHCDCTDDQDLRVVFRLWDRIKLKAVEIFSRLVVVLSLHRISFDIQPRQLTVIFDKFSIK